jgi:2-methylcitrate dehydratase PrpD
MDNRKFEAFKPYPKGEPENPMSEEELAEKFRKLVSGVAGAEKAGGLARCLDKVEKLDHIRTLVEKLNHFD